MDVVLRSEGLTAIQAAAPGHVATVRETFIDRLSAQDEAEPPAAANRTPTIGASPVR